jgi:hypothetical protein
MGGKHPKVSEGGKSRAKPLGQKSSLFGKKEHPDVRGNGMASTEEVERQLREGNDTDKFPFNPSKG